MTISDDPVEAAIRRVLDGDPRAYDTVVTTYGKLVARVVMQVIGDRGETEELVQRVFVQAFERLGGYRPGSDPGAWLVTIARNLARNHVRDRSRERRQRAALREHLLHQVDDDPLADDAEHELRVALADCCAALDDETRSVLRLHYAESITVRGIATRLGRSPAAIERLLVQARLALRQRLGARMAGT